MFKHVFMMMFVVGMMGFSLVAFAGVACDLDCDVTIKCVCESKLSGSARVVRCPEFGSYELNTDGTLGEVDCTNDNNLCPDNITCKWWEKSNCLVTLPIEVACD
jgi:hypothetical protein